MATDEAYEAAALAMYGTLDIGPARGALDAAVDAVWDLAVAEGRRQAAEAIRADTAAQRLDRYIPRPSEYWTEWAARIAAGETP
jgi:hypothetical protein